MGRYKQDPKETGSQKYIQKLINSNNNLLNTKIFPEIKTNNINNINWVSPLEEDDYAEYTDKDFIEKLDITNLDLPLKDFWPTGGPHWDALGKSKKNHVFLVEAKSHISEIVSTPTGASAEASLNLINNSLQETKNYLAANKNHNVDWSSYFYQYTNRLAHLYYLRIKNNIPAYLVFVYFINDKTVDGPETKEEWLGALKLLHGYLGLKKNHKLHDYILDVFIDIENI